MNEKAIVYMVLLISGMAILSGCIGTKEITTPGGKVTIGEGTGPSWCKAGTKITSTGSQAQGSFEIKGITKHNGTEVCQAEFVSNEGSMIQYFNEKGDYVVMVYKDKSGNITQEINVVSPSEK